MRGTARLISSASSRLVNSGPGRRRTSPPVPIVDVHAQDVGGQQVGDELDALGSAAGHGGQGLDQGGLAYAGQVLQKHVALGEQCHDDQADLRLLAVDDLGGFRSQAVCQLSDIHRELLLVPALAGFTDKLHFTTIFWEFYPQFVKKCPTPPRRAGRTVPGPSGAGRAPAWRCAAF